MSSEAHEESFEGYGHQAMSPVHPDDLRNINGQEAGQAPLASQRVSSMANRVYDELSRLAMQCGEDSLGSITPILVDLLQSLDSALADLNETQRALEEATEDNEQLLSQYEKEKKLRKEDRHQRMRNEDQGEDERRELADLVQQLRLHNRKLTSQLTASRGRAEAGEEKLEKLRQDHTDLTYKYRRVNLALQQYLHRGRSGTPTIRLRRDSRQGKEGKMKEEKKIQG